MSLPVIALAQQKSRKNTRAKPPSAESKEFDDLFFADVKQQTQGERPTAGGTKVVAGSGGNGPTKTNMTPDAPAASGAENGWASVISPGSIEDLVKGTKLRLDGIVTTPAKYAGGAYNDARREYTLLATLFGIIEQHSGQVRWKSSSTIARMRFVRVAASAKVGSIQAYNEAKVRLQDLSDLLSGSTLSDSVPVEEMNWSEAVDRVPLMQILEWSVRENLVKQCASKSEFKENQEDILKLAELTAALGTLLNEKGMSEADDPEYTKWSKAMIEHSNAIIQAVKLDSPDSARDAAALLNQSCDDCHNVYR